MPNSQPFTVLTVCTGNICRSPAMERVLRFQLADAPDVRVHSGGLAAHDGEDMRTPMKRLVTGYGADAEDFTARQVTTQMLEEADLIIAATTDHVRQMVAAHPACAAHTFTLPELGRLIEESDSDVGSSGEGAGEALAQLVPLLDQLRNRQSDDRGARRSGSERDDVVDPYMLPDEVYFEAFEQIRVPLETLRDRLVA